MQEFSERTLWLQQVVDAVMFLKVGQRGAVVGDRRATEAEPEAPPDKALWANRRDSADIKVDDSTLCCLFSLGVRKRLAKAVAV
jgi:hypothetical protein